MSRTKKASRAKKKTGVGRPTSPNGDGEGGSGRRGGEEQQGARKTKKIKPAHTNKQSHKQKIRAEQGERSRLLRKARQAMKRKTEREGGAAAAAEGVSTPSFDDNSRSDVDAIPSPPRARGAEQREAVQREVQVKLGQWRRKRALAEAGLPEEADGFFEQADGGGPQGDGLGTLFSAGGGGRGVGIRVKTGVSTSPAGAGGSYGGSHGSGNGGYWPELHNAPTPRLWMPSPSRAGSFFPGSVTTSVAGGRKLGGAGLASEAEESWVAPWMVGLVNRYPNGAPPPPQQQHSGRSRAAEPVDLVSSEAEEGEVGGGAFRGPLDDGAFRSFEGRGADGITRRCDGAGSFRGGSARGGRDGWAAFEGGGEGRGAERSELSDLHHEILRFEEYVSLTPAEVAARKRLVSSIELVATEALGSGATARAFGSYRASASERCFSIFLSDVDISVRPPADPNAVPLSQTAPTESGITAPPAEGVEIHTHQGLAGGRVGERGGRVPWRGGKAGRKATAISGLRKLGKRLLKMRWVKNFEFRSSAKIPIISLLDAGRGVDCDVAWAGHEGWDDPADAPGPAYFAKMFPGTFRPLALFLKVFMRQRGLDKPFTGGVGSFKLYALIASHLEACGCQRAPLDLGHLLLGFFRRYCSSSEEGITPETVLHIQGLTVDLGSARRALVASTEFSEAFQTLASAIDEGSGNTGSPDAESLADGGDWSNPMRSGDDHGFAGGAKGGRGEGGASCVGGADGNFQVSEIAEVSADGRRPHSHPSSAVGVGVSEKRETTSWERLRGDGIGATDRPASQHRSGSSREPQRQRTEGDAQPRRRSILGRVIWGSDLRRERETRLSAAGSAKMSPRPAGPEPDWHIKLEEASRPSGLGHWEAFPGAQSRWGHGSNNAGCGGGGGGRGTGQKRKQQQLQTSRGKAQREDRTRDKKVKRRGENTATATGTATATLARGSATKDKRKRDYETDGSTKLQRKRARRKERKDAEARGGHS